MSLGANEIVFWRQLYDIYHFKSIIITQSKINSPQDTKWLNKRFNKRKIVYEWCKRVVLKLDGPNGMERLNYRGSLVCGSNKFINFEAIRYLFGRNKCNLKSIL